MTATETMLWIGVALVGVFFSALFSGMETGVYGLNVVRMNVMARRTGSGRRRRRAALLLSEIEKPDRLLASLLIGNNLANYTGAIGVSALLTAAGLSDWGIVIVNAAVLTPLLFIFGETLPKDFFRASADRIMPSFGWLLRALRLVLTACLALPLVRLFGFAVSRLLRGSDPSAVATARMRIVALLKEGRRHGVLSESQTTLVDRAARLHERRVQNEMTPWSRVTALHADWPRERVDEEARRHVHGHYPVIDRRNRVVGVVRSIDLWLQRDTSVTTLMSSPVFLEADDPLVTAIRSMRNAGARHAVVRRRDHPVGFIAERDLLEPLLGEIEIR